MRGGFAYGASRNKRAAVAAFTLRVPMRSEGMELFPRDDDAAILFGLGRSHVGSPVVVLDAARYRHRGRAPFDVAPFETEYLTLARTRVEG